MTLSSSSELLNELCGRGKRVNQILTQAPIGDSLGKKVDPMLDSKIFCDCHPGPRLPNQW